MSFLNPNLDLKPGNYAVIFSSERPVDPSPEGYDAMESEVFGEAPAAKKAPTEQ